MNVTYRLDGCGTVDGAAKIIEVFLNEMLHIATLAQVCDG